MFKHSDFLCKTENVRLSTLL